MSRGVNSVVVSGDATGDIVFGSTAQGDAFCSFTIISERKEGKNRTAVRINVYQPGLVDVARSKLRTGMYVVVEGELTNPDRGTGCEVRAREMVFRAPLIQGG